MTDNDRKNCSYTISRTSRGRSKKPRLGMRAPFCLNAAHSAFQNQCLLKKILNKSFWTNLPYLELY